LKLPAHRAGLPGHASGEQNVGKGSFVPMMPLDPAYPALAGRGTFRSIAFIPYGGYQLNSPTSQHFSYQKTKLTYNLLIQNNYFDFCPCLTRKYCDQKQQNNVYFCSLDPLLNFFLSSEGNN
jgi:hypothetical protein